MHEAKEIHPALALVAASLRATVVGRSAATNERADIRFLPDHTAVSGAAGGVAHTRQLGGIAWGKRCVSVIGIVVGSPA